MRYARARIRITPSRIATRDPAIIIGVAGTRLATWLCSVGLLVETMATTTALVSAATPTGIQQNPVGDFLPRMRSPLSSARKTVAHMFMKSSHITCSDADLRRFRNRAASSGLKARAHSRSRTKWPGNEIRRTARQARTTDQSIQSVLGKREILRRQQALRDLLIACHFVRDLGHFVFHVR